MAKKNLKIFTEDELYQFASADNTASEFMNETGTSADWSKNDCEKLLQSCYIT